MNCVVCQLVLFCHFCSFPISHVTKLFDHETVQWLHSDGEPGTEADEHILRVILYEDVKEFLFSLSSNQARLSLVSQFIDFFGGKISQW